jgi:hypothetical protein
MHSHRSLKDIDAVDRLLESDMRQSVVFGPVTAFDLESLDLRRAQAKEVFIQSEESSCDDLCVLITGWRQGSLEVKDAAWSSCERAPPNVSAWILVKESKTLPGTLNLLG